VALERGAVRRAGDLARQIRLGDLTAAGWEVGKAQRGPDGLTWLRASKRFASMAELNAALAELTGETAMFRDFRLAEEGAGTAVAHHLTGTVDATRGIGAFADAQLG